MEGEEDVRVAVVDAGSIGMAAAADMPGCGIELCFIETYAATQSQNNAYCCCGLPRGCPSAHKADLERASSSVPTGAGETHLVSIA